MDKNLLYRSIPKVDLLLEDENIKSMIDFYGRGIVIGAIRIETEKIRAMIGLCESEEDAKAQILNLPERIGQRAEQMLHPNMQRVVNATGTILHTNLGRAPISREHMEHVAEIAAGYSNLEYNLATGMRGERYAHFETLLCELTGAEAAIAVNNNAAAVMLILSTMAKGREVVISRGELVEIGGKFRIPEVIEQSGAALVEVGTTNKTYDTDYENAITEETAALLKVHTSNYRILGFTEAVGIEELVLLGHKHDIPVIEDLGSGMLVDLSKYGISHEPTVQASIRSGADIVCFSADKLLGGPQAGIIIGKKRYLDQMKKHPLMRALRIDKFTASALEVVLKEYLSEERAVRKIPVLQMITKPLDEVLKEARRLKCLLEGMDLRAEIEVEACESRIGGGSLPLERIPSMAVTIRPLAMSTAELEEEMRFLSVPIISRTVNNKIWLDARTIGTQNFESFRQLKKIERLMPVL